MFFLLFPEEEEEVDEEQDRTTATPSFSVIEATVPYLFLFLVRSKKRVVFPAPEGPASRAARVPAAERRFLFGGRLARRKRAADYCFFEIFFFKVRGSLCFALF